jgi:type VI secretion system secreted protein VgrG
MASDTLSARLESSEFPCESLQISRVTGHEAISRPFSFAIELTCLEPGEFHLDALPGAEASLVFEIEGAEIRVVHGMIAEVDDLLSEESEARAFRLLLVPRAHRLSLVEMQEIFLSTSVPDILRQKLDLVGLGASDVEMRLLGTYERREFVVQFRETDLAFVSRLTEHLGVSWFISQEGGTDRVIFTDHPAGFRPIEGHETAFFRPRGDKRDVYRLEHKTRIMPLTWMQQDYNHRTPTLDLTASHTAASGLAGGVVEYGTHVQTPAEAIQFARIRAEEREVATRYYSGDSTVCTFTAGARVTLEGHPRLREKDLLITEVQHSFSQVTMTHGGPEAEPGYRNTFRAVDGQRPYRPARITPKPRIYGVISGLVEPKAGGGIAQRAEIDDDGRYTVRFHFDAGSAERRLKSSLPIRMSQPLAGPGYGMHFPLRPGVEVLVTFVDGDPDRPIIAGAMSHPVSPSPVTRTNASESRIQTQSSLMIIMKDS